MITAARSCPGCGSKLPPAQQSDCPKCGYSLAAGLVVRDLPHQTRGIEAVARKFGPTKSFLFAALLVFVAYVYYDDMTIHEETGKSFMIDPFTGILFAVGGKWLAIMFWLILAGFAVVVGIRARSIAAASRR